MIRLMFLSFLLLLIEVKLNLSENILNNVDPKHELLNEITGRYRLAARHLRESQTSLPFELKFLIHEIVGVNGPGNEITVRATIRLDFQFEFLHWDSNDTRSRYHEIEEVLLSKTTLQTLWLPDLRFSDDDSVSFQIEKEHGKINRDGFISWFRRGIFKVATNIDLTYFPFDRQFVRFQLENVQRALKLTFQRNLLTLSPSNNVHLARSANVWTALFSGSDFNLNLSSNAIFVQNEENLNPKPNASRGWFVRTIYVEPKLSNNENGTLESLTVSISIQRRRESHIYTLILPSLFFSFFIFIFYFAPIEAHQRLLIGLVNTFSTLIFLIHVDRKLEADQLSHSPLLIQYLTILFMIESLSLFFDHIIHSIFYGGINFVSNWLKKRHRYETQQQPARLSRVTMLTRALNNRLNSNSLEHDGQINGPTDLLMKQLIEREESLKFEDHERYQWRKRARLSECLCCWFFLAVVIAAAICIFLLVPSLALKK